MGIRRDCQCPRSHHKHGTVDAYTRDRCRCDECGAVQREALRRYRKLKAYGRWPEQWCEPHRITRRLQALAALGYNDQRLARELDVDGAWVRRVLLGETGDVARLATLRKVSEVYDRLSGTPAQGRWVNYAKRRAARHGWVPPLAWDDIDNDPNPADLDYYTRRMNA